MNDSLRAPTPLIPTVFVCYRRHDDAIQDFVNEFESFFIQKLSPYIEKRLVHPMKLWWDARVSPGDYWDEEIAHAIANASAGLILMSDSLLNSEYIVDREFPALWARHSDPADTFQLHWLHLRPTTLQDIDVKMPGLQTIQAINDLKEPALQQSWNPANRSHPQFEERFCKSVWERLSKKLNSQLLAAEERSGDPDQPASSAHLPLAAGNETMSRLEVRDQGGLPEKALSLPHVNPSWSGVGDRLSDTRGQLLRSTVATTGLVSPGATLGMYGEGGVGKTVLATQLVRDAEVAAAFQDGRYWVTLGRQPQIGPIYDVLLDEIRDYIRFCNSSMKEPAKPTDRAEVVAVLDRQRLTSSQIQRALRDILEMTNMLIVIDDVWDIGHVRDVIPAAGTSRVLITSRFPGIVRSLGGVVVHVDRLTEAEARAFLVEKPKSGLELPVATDAELARIIEISGGLLIQLALYRGMVRSGVPWSQIAVRIQRHISEVGDGELADEYRAQAVSIGEIQEHGPNFQLGGANWSLSDLLLALAVFPEDADVPREVIQLFWSASDVEINPVLNELITRRWVAYSEENATLSLHDVTRDYLRLRGPELRALNRDLIDRYRHKGLPTRWAFSTSENHYLRRNLGYHLTSGELHGEWVRTVLDPYWIAGRVVCDGISAAMEDIESALDYTDWVSANEGRALRELAFTVSRYAQLLHLAAAQTDESNRDLPFTSVASTLTTKWKAASSGSQVNLLSLYDAADEAGAIGHISGIRCLKFSNDGTRLVSGSFDERVCVWDAASGSMILRLVGHTASICMVAWSPDDRLVLSASYDGCAIVWDARSGRQIARLEGHSAPVRAIQWRPGAHQIATASSDGSIRLWETQQWETISSIFVSSIPVWSIAWAPEGDRLAAATTDGTIRIYEPHTGSCLVTILGTEDPVWSIAWSPVSDCIAAGGYDGAVRLWDATSGAYVGSLNGHSDQVNIVAWDKDGKCVASGGCDGNVNIWDAKELSLIRTLRGHGTRVPGVDWSPTVQILATGGYDGIINLWDPSTAVITRALQGETKWIWSIDCSPDTDVVATAGYDGTVRFWNAKSAALIRPVVTTGGPIWCVRWSPDGTRLASGGQDGTVRIFAADGYVEVFSGPCHLGPIWTVEWSPNGEMLATSGLDGIIKVWNVAPWSEICSLSDGRSPIWTLAWHPDSARLVAGGYDGVTRVWDTVSGHQVNQMALPGNRVWSAGWTPESARDAGNPIKSPASERETLGDGSKWSREKGCRVLCAKWSPDGRQVASARDDGLVIIWDVITGSVVHVLKGHGSWVWTASWSVGGDLLITAGEEGSARVWDTRTGRQLDVLVFGTSINEISWRPQKSSISVLSVAHGVAWSTVRIDSATIALQA